MHMKFRNSKYCKTSQVNRDKYELEKELEEPVDLDETAPILI
jgi:hypothetical protein